MTDGIYKVQYFYTEDSIKLAATGINLSNMVISSILLLFSGLFLFTKNRKKSLILYEPSKKSLDNIYKNIFILKSKIESLINEKVEILINFNKLNPYIYKGLYTESQNEIIDNLKNKFGYKNNYQVPKLEKIVLNMGIGEAKDDQKILIILSATLPDQTHYLACLF